MTAAVPIPTASGPMTPTDDDVRYMNYLDEIMGQADYGLSLFKGDQIAFTLGRNEWLGDPGIPYDEDSRP